MFIVKMEINRELRLNWCHGEYVYDIQLCKLNYLIKLLELLKLILTKHIKIPVSKKSVLFLTLLCCSHHESVLAHCPSSSFCFFSIYRCSDALVVDVQTYEAIFVGYVYTLTDGPSCRNVSPLLWDVLETPCQLLIQADWWQKETNRRRTLKLSLDDRTYWLVHR